MVDKFKIGDKVKVVKQYGNIELPCPIGSEGKITKICLISNSYSYVVKSNKKTGWFAAQELKKI